MRPLKPTTESLVNQAAVAVSVAAAVSVKATSGQGFLIASWMRTTQPLGPLIAPISDND
jgi:hypothetical protein